MAEYIEREAAVERVKYGAYTSAKGQHEDCVDAWVDGVEDTIEQVCEALSEIPAADVVSKAVFDQVMWERNTAINQLREDYGVGLGEKKADVVPVVHGEWEEADDGDGAICSVCREDFCNVYLEVDRFNYCPNCGARMDGE